MKKVVVVVLLAAVAFTACDKADQTKTGNSEEIAKDAEKIISESSGGEGCYIPYQAKVCELIDAETVAQILGVDAAKMEVNDVSKQLHEMGKNKDKPYKGSAFTNCEYKWEDKDKKIKEYIAAIGQEIEMPIYAYVQIGSFAPRKDVAAFKQYYRNVSQEEMDKAMGKAGEQMEKSGKYTKEQVDTAKDLGGGLVAGRNVTYLDNLGEAAASIRSKAYGEQTEVIVYYKGNEFHVEVKMAGKTHAENMEYTLKIAQEVLKKCK